MAPEGGDLIDGTSDHVWEIACCGGSPVTRGDGRALLWHGANRSVLGEATSVAALPDGRLVIGRGDGQLRFWERGQFSAAVHTRRHRCRVFPVVDWLRCFRR